VTATEQLTSESFRSQRGSILSLAHGCFAWLLAGLLAAGSAGADPASTAEIEHLLNYVSHSECRFVRNGDSHSGAEAARHMRQKYDHFADRIDSAESFIELAATRSLLSGKAYTASCPGQSPQPTGAWLGAELETYRETAADVRDDRQQ
jgi:hypothetical protein